MLRLNGNKTLMIGFLDDCATLFVDGLDIGEGRIDDMSLDSVTDDDESVRYPVSQ
ncbi:MAG TPA: hypothetical protein VHL08_08575 [Dongiaceae bacterium]|nr:hypothetical protein [Dongiaceae bacterium]